MYYVMCNLAHDYTWKALGVSIGKEKQLRINMNIKIMLEIKKTKIE